MAETRRPAQLLALPRTLIAERADLLRVGEVSPLVLLKPGTLLAEQI